MRYDSSQVSAGFLEAREPVSVPSSGTVSYLLDPVDADECNVLHNPDHEVVRYEAAARGNFSGGRISLTCGNEKVGYIHIRIRHQDDWQGKLAKTGGSAAWDDFMHFATNAALTAPSAWADEGSNKYCYTTPVRIYNDDTLVDTFYPKVIISLNFRRVTTSYPTERGCVRSV